jgi:hypothetical protein
MVRHTEKLNTLPRLTHEDDPGQPGGGKGRVETTGMSSWTPPEGQFPPGEAYYESGSSEVMPPERFAEQTGVQYPARRVKIDIVPDNHHWVIVRGFHVVKQHPTTCFDSPPPGLPLWEGCWSGTQWAATTDHARRFETRREAEAYLSEHRKEIEESLVSVPPK